MNGFLDAFISYGRADSKTFATQLHRRMIDLGLKVWFDQNDIPLGVDFQRQIDEGIRSADNFLFIIAPHSINSPYCRREIELAIKCNKRIIPLLHVEQINRDIWQQRNQTGTDAEWETYKAKALHSSFPNMHPAIGKINWVYFREEIDDFEKALTGLLEILERHREYVRQHTFFLDKALDWEMHQKQSRYLLIGEERQQAEAWLKLRFENEQPPCTPTDLHCEFITESTKNANNLMAQVFLAHAEADSLVMERVCRSLRREGFTVWTHRTDIQTGATFEEAIDRGIEEADNVVYLLSPAALKSKYCQHELDYALSLNKRVIPLLVSATDLNLASPILQRLQYIDFTDNLAELDYLQDESQLLRILKQDAAYYEEHKILLAKALKWERQHRNPSILLQGYNLHHAETWLKVAQQREQHLPTPLQQEFIAESLRQPPGLSLDVFVSYSRTDSDFARRLNDALQFQGKTTWFDQESIASGVDFQQEIYRGIEHSSHFLFIISPSSIRSPYCADEVEHAQKLNKRIVTVLYRPVDPAELHPGLAAVQWIDFNQRNGDFSANFNELIRTLDTDRDHLKAHTRLLVRAIEWDNAGRKESLLLRGDELERSEQWLVQSAQKQPSPTDLHTSYIQISRSVEDASQKATQILQAAAAKGKQRVLIGTIAMVIGLIVAGIAGIAAYRATKQATVASQQAKEAQQGTKLEREGTAVLKQFEIQQLDALLAAIKTGQELQAIVKDHPLETYPAYSPLLALQTILDNIRLQNQFSTKPGEVVSASFLPDGQRLILIDIDGTVRLWHRSGKQQAEFNVGKELWSASVSRDGQQIAAIDKNGILHVWTRRGEGVQLQARQQFRVSDGKNYVSVSIAPDGQRIATLIESDTATLWSLNGQRLTTFKIGGSNLSFSPDGQRIATVDRSERSTIRIWNLKQQQIEQQFKTDQAMIFSLSFSPDGQRMALAGANGIIRLLNLKGQTVDEIKTEQKYFSKLGFSQDSNQLVAAGDDGTVQLWNLAKPPIEEFSTQAQSVLAIAFSPDGKQVFTASGTTSVKVLNLSGNLLPDLPIRLQGVMGVAVSSDGNTVALSTDAGNVQLFDRAGHVLGPAFQAHEGNAFSVRFSPDGTQLLTAGSDSSARLWNLSGQRQAEFRPSQLREKSSIYSASFSPDGQQIVTASGDGTVTWWTLTGEMVDQFNAYESSAVWGVSVSPDEHRFATVGENGIIRLWSKNKNLLAEYKFPQKALTLSFSPDGSHIAIGSESGIVRLIPVETLPDLLKRGCTWLKDYLNSRDQQGDRSLCHAPF